ncbi:two-component sensor histidine kinase [Anaerocolumna sedimenticola]|uniref:histidine kinase n=1 Tax=Anaerocolumna sedimenticola TaxID=2696063 RepID=A0A6P1TJP5_9FIRM|nr:HAMP domain-containing sensor histidine kinase [Anaerocolumna sedimenticola]QHQ60271.1 two-component sensor histidine kinase [Anaerocolumna sedimenticola]
MRESIRQLLIKIVLPFRRKKEEWLGKFRFSIAFRISLHYLKLLIINGAVFAIIFSMLYYGAEWRNYNKKADRIMENFKNNGKSQNNKILNPYIIDGFTLKIINKDTKSVIYNDTGKDYSGDKKIFGYITYQRNDNVFMPIIIISENREITTGDETYKLYFQYNLEESGEKLDWLLGFMIILYLVLVYIIIKQGKKSDQKLLEPIYEMSASANHLTVNNLHSQRLNVEGTKNELKDLANVINSMLDRIEVSYESQKQFVSDASHELRTPIAVIQGYGNLLSRWGTKDEEVLLESIEAINNEAKSMQDLVEKLLFLSRHDKKTLKLEKVKFNMCHVVEEMVKETRLVTANRSIESPVLEDIIVYGDKQALKQAIRVFIDNAVKYTRDGDTITIKCQNDDGDCVITVQDTGIGMTRKDVDNIFERFYRSDQVRNEKIYGHGLGLSIAKLIILGHTGRIKVRSQLTKGTTFIITLPKRF